METWHPFEVDPEYLALWSLRYARALVACRRYMAGQFRLQVSIGYDHSGGWSITTPEV